MRTPESDAFRKAIIAYPNDTRTHGVFADYLGERNDPRGTFISIQLELENLKLLPHQRKRLLDEQEPLLKAHRTEWIDDDLAIMTPEQKAGLNRKYLTFSRGFLDVMTMNATQLERMKGLHQTPMLMPVSRDPLQNPDQALTQLVEINALSRRQARPPISFTLPELKTLIMRGLTLNHRRSQFMDNPLANNPLAIVITQFSPSIRLQAMQTLLDAGTKVDSHCAPSYASPLHNIVSLLGDPDLRHFRHAGENAFHDEVRLLIRNGAKTSKRDEEGESVTNALITGRSRESALLQAIRDEQAKIAEERKAERAKIAEERKNQPMTARIPPKGSGPQRGRGRGTPPTQDPEI